MTTDEEFAEDGGGGSMILCMSERVSGGDEKSQGFCRRWNKWEGQGRNTKLHAVCDAKGRPLVLLLTPGNVHDCKVAQRYIEAMPPAAELVADKGYDSKALRDWLAERGTTAVIPPRKNR